MAFSLICHLNYSRQTGTDVEGAANSYRYLLDHKGEVIRNVLMLFRDPLINDFEGQIHAEDHSHEASEKNHVSASQKDTKH
jgi:hypothetical protein